jgi:hypothetical protein
VDVYPVWVSTTSMECVVDRLSLDPSLYSPLRPSVDRGPSIYLILDRIFLITCICPCSVCMLLNFHLRRERVEARSRKLEDDLLLLGLLCRCSALGQGRGLGRGAGRRVRVEVGERGEGRDGV